MSTQSRPTRPLPTIRRRDVLRRADEVIAKFLRQAHHRPMAAVTCCWCQAVDDGAHVDWAFSRRGDAVTYACPTCARVHLSDLESVF